MKRSQLQLQLHKTVQVITFSLPIKAPGKMSGGHYLPNRVTAYGPVAEIPAFIPKSQISSQPNNLKLST